MCGIAGFSLAPADLAEVNPASLSKRLALAIEHRGKDATGVAYNQTLESDIRLAYTKADMTATAWARAGHHRQVVRDTASGLIHTRASTQGSPKDNVNNHPIPVAPIDGKPGLIGVHNGIIWNDHTVWRHYPDLAARRQGEVDSEVIWHLYQHHGLKGLEELEGDASIAWMATDDPETVHLARLGGRPLAAAVTVEGSMIFASTPECLLEAVGYFRQIQLDGEPFNLANGEYLAFHNGGITDYSDKFPVITRPPRQLGKGWSYQTGSGWGWDDDWFDDKPPALPKAKEPKVTTTIDDDGHVKMTATTPIETESATLPFPLTEVEERLLYEFYPWWQDDVNHPDVRELAATALELIYAQADPELVDRVTGDINADLMSEDETAIRAIANGMGQPVTDDMLGMPDWEPEQEGVTTR